MNNFRYFFAVFLITLICISTNGKLLSESVRFTDKLYDEEIALSVLVLDKKDQPVTNLGNKDFRVFVENEKQEITRFTNEPQPLFMGIALDASGSLRTQFNGIANAYNTLINNLMENDEAFLMKFVSKDKIYELEDFTSNKRMLASAFDEYYVEGGRTALLDAIYKSADKLGNYKTDEKQQRVLILLTDGDEEESIRKEEEVFKLLRETNVQVFVIGLVQLLENEGNFFGKSRRDKATLFLDKLTRETGGRSFYLKRSTDIHSVVQELILNLRSQYTIYFVPNDQKKGSYKVRVEINETQGREKLKVITRPGYTIR